MQADVQALMGGELGNWLAEQSAMRAEAKKKAFDRWFYGGIAALPVLAFLWFWPGWVSDWKVMLTFGAVMAISAWGYQPINKAKKEIKVGINSAIANSLGISYEHDVDPGNEFEAAKDFGLLPSHDRSDFEDLWYGDIEGHNFQLYEAHLEERRGSGKNRRWVTVFRGAIIAMEFGRAFHSTTLLQRAGKHKKWFGLGGRKDTIKIRGEHLDFVDQVHPSFDELFEVYSTDQVEARFIVHPNYVEHLIALEKAFQGDAVRALFSHGEVVIAVESGNLFESGHISEVGDEMRVERTAEQFAALARLAMAINQTDRGRAMTDAKERGSQEIAPDLPDTPPREAERHPESERGITASDRLGAQRSAGGFGRKGL